MLILVKSARCVITALPLWAHCSEYWQSAWKKILWVGREEPQSPCFRYHTFSSLLTPRVTTRATVNRFAMIMHTLPRSEHIQILHTINGTNYPRTHTYVSLCMGLWIKYAHVHWLTCCVEFATLVKNSSFKFVLILFCSWHQDFPRFALNQDFLIGPKIGTKFAQTIAHS